MPAWGNPSRGGYWRALLHASRSRQPRWRLTRTMVEAADVAVIAKNCGTCPGEGSDGKTLAFRVHLLLTDGLGSVAHLPGIAYPLSLPVKRAVVLAVGDGSGPRRGHGMVFRRLQYYAVDGQFRCIQVHVDHDRLRGAASPNSREFRPGGNRWPRVLHRVSLGESRHGWAVPAHVTP